MQIIIKHFFGERPQFNVGLASKPGAEPFIEIKGCRIVSGKNGEFVSWPATKKPDNTYWNHVYASEAFATAVLQEAKKAAPSKAPARGRYDYDDGSPPF